jgi:hypothetical protein
MKYLLQIQVYVIPHCSSQNGAFLRVPVIVNIRCSDTGEEDSSRLTGAQNNANSIKNYIRGGIRRRLNSGNALSRVLLVRLRAIRLVSKNPQPYMEPEVSLPCLKNLPILMPRVTFHDKLFSLR